MKLTEIFQLICYYFAALIDVNLTSSTDGMRVSAKLREETRDPTRGVRRTRGGAKGEDLAGAVGAQ
jgi:hypothetical protein